MRPVLDLPLLVILIGIAGLAMLVPGAYGFVSGDLPAAVAFGASAALVLGLTLLLALATARYRPANVARSQFLSLVGAYLVLPVILAAPMVEAVPDGRFLDLWFEMVSSFTTTGATIFDHPQEVAASVHLWRALVGWLGGLFLLIAASALLAPLSLGGFEVISGRPAGRTALGPAQIEGGRDPSQRFLSYTRLLAPVYAALTAVLWVALLLAGDSALVAACHAMSTLATSAISPVGGTAAPGVGSGIAGEVLILLFLCLAFTRRAMPGAPQSGQRQRLRHDPELRLALLIVGTVTAVLFLRHAVGAYGEGQGGVPAALRAFWGSAFTTTSFLSTNGFVSGEWAGARAWSGLATPGLVLLGLALVGGGVATTAGGVKLLRILALYRQGTRELERLLYPSAVAGGGAQARHIRREGAQAAWIYFMLFVISVAALIVALAATGLELERALVFTVAALTTTGPLAGFAAEAPLLWSELGDASKLLLALAMVLGRLETLALVALVLPEVWRR